MKVKKKGGKAVEVADEVAEVLIRVHGFVKVEEKKK
jgi:hypothetical protein